MTSRLPHPLVLGTGRRLFDNENVGRIDLTHTESTLLGNGARLDVYRPKR